MLAMTARLRTDDAAIQRDVRRLVGMIADMAAQGRWLAAEAAEGDYARLYLVNIQARAMVVLAERAKRRYEQRKKEEK